MTRADEKVTVRAIVDAVDSYVDGSLTLTAFEDWFMPETWNLGAGRPTKASKLANEIWLRLAEHDMGHVDEHELKSLLRAAISAPANI